MSQKKPDVAEVAGGAFVSTIHNDTYPAIDPAKYDLSNKTVFITGASKGIGRASASSFAKAGASNIILGARSSLEDVEKEVLSAAKGAGKPEPQILSLKLDISSQASVDEAAKRVSEKFSAIDILINMAGFLEPWTNITESKPETWWTTFEINVFGTYLMCRAFLPLILKSQSKTIINIVSYGAHRQHPSASAYQTSKLAVCRFTEFLMTEHGEDGLIALCAHPGGVKTDLASGMPKYMVDRMNDTPYLGADTFVAWTAERRDWMAGRFLSVSWDWDELQGKQNEITGDVLKVRLVLS